MSSKILVLGNSHTQALSAVVQEQSTLEIRWLKTKSDARFGDLTMDEAHKLIDTLSPQDRLVIMHLGALHNVFGLLNHDEPFTFSDLQDDRENTNLICRSTMRAHMREQVRRDRVLKALSEKAPCPVYHCMTPPPKETPPLPKSDTKAYRGLSIRSVGFAPAQIRREMWRLEYSEIQNYCEELGVSFLAPPEGTATPDGYLEPECYAADATHANDIYGAKLYTQLHALMNQ